MATYDSYMAGSGQQSTLDAQRANGSYNAAAAAYNNGGSKSSGTDFNSILAQAMDAQKKANEPVIQSYQAQIPVTNQLYEQKGTQLKAEVDPLTKQYNDLLDSIKGQQTQSVNTQTTASAAEMGKRGIPISSGLAQQDIINKNEPINQAYQSQYNQTGTAKESALKSLNDQIANLPLEQQQAVNAINTAIAQLQAGGNSSATSTALDLYKTNLASQPAAVDPLDEAIKQAQLTAANLANTKASNALKSTGTTTTNNLTSPSTTPSTTEAKPTNKVTPTTNQNGIWTVTGVTG